MIQFRTRLCQDYNVRIQKQITQFSIFWPRKESAWKSCLRGLESFGVSYSQVLLHGLRVYFTEVDNYKDHQAPHRGLRA